MFKDNIQLAAGYSKMEIFSLLIFLVISFELGATTSCPNSTANGDTKPLYLLVLLATLESSEHAFVAATIAQEEINNRSDILPGYHIKLIRDTVGICTSSQADIGLSNLVEHTVSPQCRPCCCSHGTWLFITHFNTISCGWS